MDSKKLKAEVDVLTQIMPSACSNVIELCKRYLAAREKMPDIDRRRGSDGSSYKNRAF